MLVVWRGLPEAGSGCDALLRSQPHSTVSLSEQPPWPDTGCHVSGFCFPKGCFFSCGVWSFVVFFPAVFLGPLPDSSEFLMDFPEQT